MTRIPTATNYGTELSEEGLPLVSAVSSRGLDDNTDDPRRKNLGPWFYDATLLGTPRPRRVLVKTHCSGYCDDCGPERSLVSYDEFAKACITTWGSQDNNRTTYGDDTLSKIRRAVHLVRNPYDNLVARMHRGIRKRKLHLNWTSSQLGAFDDTPEGFRAWCDHVDGGFFDAGEKPKVNSSISVFDKYGGVFSLSSEILALASRVPCFADWIRYVRWHEHAAMLSERMKLDVCYVYYEDYGTSPNATHDQLLDFLGMGAVEGPLPFSIGGKKYGSLYTSDQARAAALLVRALASPKVWSLLRSYVAPYLDEKDLSGARASPGDIIRGGKATAITGSHLAQSRLQLDQQHKIVWLLSFPNSGTSYTLENVMRLTNRSVATQYGHEALRASGKIVPVLSDRDHGHRPDHGPFWLAPHGTSFPRYVLTKTHCAGFCSACKRLDAFVSPDTFLEGCRQTTRGEWASDALQVFRDRTYLPSKAVHLIRHPLDNLVSRMHLGVREHGIRLGLDAGSNSSNRKNLLRWCAHIDDIFELSGYTGAWLTFTDRAKELFRNFPCYSDLFRYVQWHNMALEVMENLGRADDVANFGRVPVHVVYHEDYTTRYNATVHGLLDFLHLSSQVDDDREASPFVSGKTYLSYYNRTEWMTAAHIVQFLASPKVWELLRRYFLTPPQAFEDKSHSPSQKNDATTKREHLFEWNPNQREIVWLLSCRGSVRCNDLLLVCLVAICLPHSPHHICPITLY